MKDIKSLSDEELASFVREKDKELYGEIIRRYQEKLLRYVEKIVRDEHIAQDAVQEAFIKAYVNLNSFNTNKKFSSWIYRISHNEAINLIKKEKKKVSLGKNKWMSEMIEDKNVDIEKEFERKELIKTVRKLLKRLPVKYRSPITLFYLEEKSYEEISDILRIPVGTVGTRINRGKKIIAKFYKGGENDG